ncbi:hypothetical protein F4778DRAFT_205683 [Xylariomycetidae sp. FL2044]|nr:hypothetical protein F4778DRAFT_205683 [Xylariomycetidae sp. FL2044]
MGGGGSFSLSTVIITEIVPPSSYPKYTANLSLVIALSLLLWPIFGGAINPGAKWRWIFYIIVPPGVVAFRTPVIAMPWEFPYQGLPDHKPASSKMSFSEATLEKTDLFGTLLLLLAILSLTAGFEEAGSQYLSRSAYVFLHLFDCSRPTLDCASCVGTPCYTRRRSSRACLALEVGEKSCDCWVTPLSRFSKRSTLLLLHILAGVPLVFLRSSVLSSSYLPSKSLSDTELYMDCRHWNLVFD